MRKPRWIVLVILLATGLLIVPVAAYVLGGRIVGPYAGPRGLASYIGAIYSDAARGRLLALVILAGPLLGIGAWPIRGWVLRRRTGGPTDV